MDPVKMKGVLKYAPKGHGAPYAMTVGMRLTLEWCADHWENREEVSKPYFSVF